MSELSPSQMACNHAVEKLAYAITDLNIAAKYQSADGLENLLLSVRDRIASVTGDLDRIEKFAAEAGGARSKAFG